MINIYTDGSCDNKKGHGGWGAVIFNEGLEIRLSKAFRKTTSNRMELLGVISALEVCITDEEIMLYTDSQYVSKGFNEYMLDWKKNNWKKGIDRGIKNLDLWQLLDLQDQRLNVVVVWVKGHAGNEGNEIADMLAGQAMNKARSAK